MSLCESDLQNIVPAAWEDRMDYPKFLLMTEPWTAAASQAWCSSEAPPGQPQLCLAAPAAALLPPAGGGGLRPGDFLLRVIPQHLSPKKGWGVSSLPQSAAPLPYPSQPSPAHRGHIHSVDMISVIVPGFKCPVIAHCLLTKVEWRALCSAFEKGQCPDKPVWCPLATRFLSI